MKKLILCCALACIGPTALAFTNDRAGFSIEINGETIPYKLFSVFVLPGEQFTIKSDTSLLITGEGMKILISEPKNWKLQAPVKPGTYQANIKDLYGNKMHLNVLVLTPISEKKGEYLNGYRIGNYPMKPLNGNPIYNRPKGFFEVTEANKDLQLSPHFTLNQFLCKQAGDFPKYVIVRSLLLLKLEYLLEKVNQNGFEIDTFGFISGYRTPYYNKMIKNVPYSRHVYGGAADIYISSNGTGGMEDLNKDGAIDEKDVSVFYNIVEGEFSKPSYDKYKGGLGFYRKNSRHNGFIHVDVRGWKARW